MKKIILGSSGIQVSQVCLGTMLMGSSVNREPSYGMLDRFVEFGGDFLDTANCYAWWVGKGEYVGHESETLLGNWMKERGNRHQIFLATKVGGAFDDVKSLRDDQGNVYWDKVIPSYQSQTEKVIRAEVEGSLRRLQTDVIDLYYAHIDDRKTPLEETLRVFNDLVKEGKVRFIACSNYRTWRLERSRQICEQHQWAPYIAVQQEYSYFRPKVGADMGIGVHVDDEMIDYLKANPQVTLLAYSPLLKGIYDDAQKRQSYYNWHFYDTDDTRARLEVLSKLAQELGVSNNQLVLAWLLHRTPLTVPIISASSLPQFEHNMQALSINLSPEQMARLDAASV